MVKTKKIDGKVFKFFKRFVHKRMANSEIKELKKFKGVKCRLINVKRDKSHPWYIYYRK